MGRANVYLPDDLERRVKVAQIPISEVCQRALLAAVQAAEAGGGPLDDGLREHVRRGRVAGEEWARTAAPDQLLTLVRDQRFREIPADALPEDLYSLTAEQSLAWEAGFSLGARESSSLAVAQDRAGDNPDTDAPEVSDDAEPVTAGDGGSACRSRTLAATRRRRGRTDRHHGRR